MDKVFTALLRKIDLESSLAMHQEDLNLPRESTKSFKTHIKKRVFEKSFAFSIDEINEITNEDNFTKLFSTMLTSNQASQKKNDESFCQCSVDKKKKTKPNFKYGVLIRTAYQKVIEIVTPL